MARPSTVLKQFVRQVVATLGERDGGRRVRRRPSDTETRAVTTGVRIEYTPELDGDPDPGEVVWTWVPYEDDPSMGKDRPVVIIGRTGDVLTGVPLTSNSSTGGRRGRGGPDEAVPVGSGPWDSKGRPSYARVDRLIAVTPSAVRREGAILNRRAFDHVVEGVARHHQVTRA